MCQMWAGGRWQVAGKASRTLPRCWASGAQQTADAFDISNSSAARHLPVTCSCHGNSQTKELLPRGAIK